MGDALSRNAMHAHQEVFMVLLGVLLLVSCTASEM
jgi:hypothetical protein